MTVWLLMRESNDECNDYLIDVYATREKAIADLIRFIGGVDDGEREEIENGAGEKCWWQADDGENYTIEKREL